MSNLGKNILIVEDDEMVSKWLAVHLEDKGYNVIHAASGEEMRASFRDQETDLVLLDLGLPDIDGMELAEEIRSFSKVPIIVLTARQGREDRLTALGIGADDYLIKPCDPDELILRVGNILIRSGAVGFYRQQADAPATKLGYISKLGIAGIVLVVVASGFYFGMMKNSAKTPPMPTATNWPFNSKCEKSPTVSWWGNITHFSMVQYVNDKHDGDWHRYIDKWVNQLHKLQDVYARGSFVKVSDGTRLSGDVLKEHIGKLEKRVAITRCLARESKTQNVSK